MNEISIDGACKPPNTKPLRANPAHALRRQNMKILLWNHVKRIEYPTLSRNVNLILVGSRPSCDQLFNIRAHATRRRRRAKGIEKDSHWPNPLPSRLARVPETAPTQLAIE